MQLVPRFDVIFHQAAPFYSGTPICQPFTNHRRKFKQEKFKSFSRNFYLILKHFDCTLASVFLFSCLLIVINSQPLFFFRFRLTPISDRENICSNFFVISMSWWILFTSLEYFFNHLLFSLLYFQITILTTTLNTWRKNQDNKTHISSVCCLLVERKQNNQPIRNQHVKYVGTWKIDVEHILYLLLLSALSTAESKLKRDNFLHD